MLISSLLELNFLVYFALFKLVCSSCTSLMCQRSAVVLEPKTRLKEE